MINKDNQVVCDVTKIILNDGVTVYPGYVEVTEGRIYQHDAGRDPHNHIPVTIRQGKNVVKNPEWKPGMLLNRVEYDVRREVGETDSDLNGMHFKSLAKLREYEQNEIRHRAK